MNDLIPILGILVGIIIPVSVFIWLYLESKDRNRTILEISKNLEDPSKLEGMIDMLDERKKNQLILEELGLLHYLLVWVCFYLVYFSWVQYSRVLGRLFLLLG